MRGNITIPLNVEVTLDIEKWIVNNGTADFDEVKESTEEFIRNALDAWLLSEELGYVER